MTSEKKPSSTRLAASVPGALTAVMLVGAIAFGATALRQPDPGTDSNAVTTTAFPAPDPDAKPQFDHATAARRRDAFKQDPTGARTEVIATPKPVAKAEPANPKPKATKAPEQAAPAAQPKPAAPKKTEKPKPAPAPVQTGTLALEGWPKESKAKLMWTTFAGEGFDYYKVVRSLDAVVAWPATGDDQVVGAVGDRNAPSFADRAPCGAAWHYGVFAVSKGGGAYQVLAASNVVAVTIACPPVATPGQVFGLAFDVQVRPGEGIKLAWEACGAPGFVAYKVVRSAVNADPRFPLNDGAELIAAIGNPGQTHFLDTEMAAGQTWNYRVVAVANGGGGYVPLCQTGAVAATAQ